MHQDMIPYQELMELQRQIRSIPYPIKRDLLIMARTCERLWSAADQEFVTCRRLNKVTAKYQELMQDFTTAKEHLAQYVIFAMLL